MPFQLYFKSVVFQFSFSADKPPSRTRIVAAMSGGVDSSVVAAGLHRLGYDVIGVTLQLYDDGAFAGRKGACCAGKDIYDARDVAERAGFPHYVFNYESLFKQSVIDDFADSYARGETPVPCVRCNQSVKFRDLLKAARDLEADALVTGHYVRRTEGPGGPELRKAAEAAKDQSYFLFATTREQLEYLRFPLGGYPKAKTREFALELGLSIADKPDSQDICFVPGGDYREVLARLRPGCLEPGEIVHTDGRVLGRHSGAIGYTRGQRKGLGVAWHEPLYVVRTEPETRRVIVGPVSALESVSFRVKEWNWLGAEPLPNEGLVLEARLRSTHPGTPATVTPDGNGGVMVEMHSPERAVTPGQACVLYEDDRVMGGGFIVRD